MEIHFKQFGLFLFAIIMLILLVGCGTQATISFDTNGGSPIDDITFTVGEGVDMPDNPTKEGYQFEDWYIDKDLTNLLVDIQNIEEDITLYAKWSELEYTVTFYSGEDQEDAVTTKYGEEAIAPIPETKEGYTFTGWDNDFSNVTSDMDVNAEYSKNSYSVTFHYGDNQEEVVITKYGEGAIAPTNTEKDKYIFEKWDTDFSNITSDLEVNAIYNIDPTQGEVDTYTVTFNYGDNESIIREVEYSKAAIAPTNDEVMKTGYTFTGWDNTFNNITENKIITAQYIINTYDVTFIYNDKTEVVKTNYGTAAIAPTDTDKTGYEFTGWDADFTNITSSITVNGTYVIKTLNVTFDMPEGTDDIVYNVSYNQSLNEVPEVPEKDGYVAYWSSNNFFAIQNDLTVTPSYVEKFGLQNILYEQSVVEKLDNDNVRWVFYENEVYPFSNYNKEIIGSSDIVSLTADNYLQTNGCGVFYIKLTSISDQTTKIYMGQVMPHVYSFSLGEAASEYTALNTTIQFTKFLNVDINPYLVGNSNIFKMDLNITDSNGTTLDDVLLKYSFKLIDGDTETTISNDDIGIINDEGIIFDSAWIGKTIEVTAYPRYAPAVNVSDPETYSTEFTIKINDGVNVYTDDDLEEAFADLDVLSINIQRNITPVLRPTQLNDDGSPLNYTNDLGRTETGNPYLRISNEVSNNKCVINGNYFTIHGENLPINIPHDSDDYPGQADQSCSGSAHGTDYTVCDVRNSIFYSKLYDETNSTSDTISDGNSVTFNNLIIVSNTETIDQNFGEMTEAEIDAQFAAISYNSGGYPSITGENIDINANNVVMAYSTIGIIGRRAAGNINANYVNIYNSWANAIYGHGIYQYNISNSKLTNSGGAAIDLEDIYPGMTGTLDPAVTIDTATTIQNLVTGTEPWFKIYNINTLATQITGGLETSINSLTSGTKTILTEYENSDGFSSQMFNFAILYKAADNVVNLTGEEALNCGGQFSYQIGNSDLVKRSYDFTTSGEDLRVQSNQYIGLAGYDVDGALFTEKYNYYISLGLDSTTASQYALAEQFSVAGIGNGYLELTIYAGSSFGQMCMLTKIKNAESSD